MLYLTEIFIWNGETMEIISVKEKEFKEYGKVIEGLDVAQLLQ